jgi:hypothetical protein
VPSFEKVKLNVCPWLSESLANVLVVAVFPEVSAAEITLWTVLSLLVQVTVVPAVTVSVLV